MSPLGGPSKPKKVYVGNQQGKRICGYQLVNEETIEKNGYFVKREIRIPVFEGEGKFEGVTLPEKFLREFMYSQDEIPEGLTELAPPNR